MKLCEYGCGQKAKYVVTKTGKMCCEKHINKCPNIKLKNSEGQKRNGFKWSEEDKKIMSIRRTGKNNGMYGKQHSVETKQKLRNRLKGKTYEELYGEEKAKELKRNYSQKMKNRKAWNKGLTGSDYCSIETINKWKKSSTERKHSEFSKNKISEANKGKIRSEKTKKQISNKLKKIWKDEFSIFNTKDFKEKKSKASRYTLKDYQNKYPYFCKIEDLKEDKNGNIYAHCKYNECINSKENGGWFIPTSYQLSYRKWAIEHPDGNEAAYLYCSEYCKQNCTLSGKSIVGLIKEDQIRAGIIKEEYYTSEEYQTWRKEVLKRSNNLCEYCEQPAEHCHHIEPQKLQPYLSLDPDNGLACCKECHYKYGHKDECSTGNLAHKVCL